MSTTRRRKVFSSNASNKVEERQLAGTNGTLSGVGLPGQLATVVGVAGYVGQPSPLGEVEMGVSLLPEWRGKGYGTEMVSALIDNAFSDPRVGGIIANVSPFNLPARKLMESCGLLRVTGKPSRLLRYERTR